MKLRVCWLVFILIVVVLVFVPQIILRAETPQYVYCDKGMCVMTEQVFEALHSLAKKAGKGCT